MSNASSAPRPVSVLVWDSAFPGNQGAVDIWARSTLPRALRGVHKASVVKRLCSP
jgi:hypothetical protein